MYKSERAVGETSLVENLKRCRLRYITGCPQLTLEKGLRDCSTHQKQSFKKNWTSERSQKETKTIGYWSTLYMKIAEQSKA
jgi:hypothetical protein